MGSESADDRDDHTTQRVARPSQGDDVPTPTDSNPPPDSIPETPRSGIATPQPPAPAERAETQAGGRRSGEDTLLSLPTPADGDDLASNDPRLGELERRLDALDARLKVLEVGSGPVWQSGKRWLVWIAFMVTLAVAWQIVRQLR